eukprot:CAMPEP_0179480732 /NCGR_PEP_ID=MMETSP0799-20121207/58626_1 /TAXON_ID=46947 /ORGANISM="Geminigera cryophila, Strain CCMP2564" /LENGTH=275 /DNA_ID=CAMNT_0021292965 /DNA_START=238 /DNA_END=1065 /DNA_ORIENTATION=+
MIHRTLNTESLVLDSKGNVKICSFSQIKVIKERRADAAGDKYFQLYLNQHADHRYLAPELIHLILYDCAVDWWALGVIMYQLMIGHLPFEIRSLRSTDGKSISSSGMRNEGGEEYLSIQDQILYTEPTFDDDVDIWAKELISRFLDKNPSSRLGGMSGSATYSSKGGTHAIKNAAFFKSIDFQELIDGRMKTPFKPVLFYPGLTNNMFPHLTQDVSSSQSTPRLVSERFALPPILSSASFKIRSDKGQRGEEDGAVTFNSKLGSKFAIADAFSDF